MTMLSLFTFMLNVSLKFVGAWYYYVLSCRAFKSMYTTSSKMFMVVTKRASHLTQVRLRAH